MGEIVGKMAGKKKYSMAFSEKNIYFGLNKAWTIAFFVSHMFGWTVAFLQTFWIVYEIHKFAKKMGVR